MTSITKLAFALAGTLFLLGCGGGAEEATDETVADTTAMEEGIALEDIAGTWNMRAVPVSGDTTATEYQLVATATDATLHLPDRDPIVGTTSVSGDSIMIAAGPYESVRRPGTMVSTNSVLRLVGDGLVGMTTAHYETDGADSTLQLNVEGWRAP